jgi:transketolase
LVGYGSLNQGKEKVHGAPLTGKNKNKSSNM